MSLLPAEPERSGDERPRPALAAELALKLIGGVDELEYGHGASCSFPEHAAEPRIQTVCGAVDGVENSLQRGLNVKEVHVPEHEEEFVATDAPHQVVASDSLGKRRCYALERLVAGLVTDAVVDRAEALQVQGAQEEILGSHPRLALLAAGRRGHLALESVLDRLGGHEPGETVGEGAEIRLLLLPLESGDRLLVAAFAAFQKAVLVEDFADFDEGEFTFHDALGVWGSEKNGTIEQKSISKTDGSVNKNGANVRKDLTVYGYVCTIPPSSRSADSERRRTDVRSLAENLFDPVLYRICIEQSAAPKGLLIYLTVHYAKDSKREARDRGGNCGSV